MTPVVVHFANDTGAALCRFVPRATVTDFAHEITCGHCKRKLDGGPGTASVYGQLVDCPHCHKRHGDRWACDELLAAAAP